MRYEIEVEDYPNVTLYICQETLVNLTLAPHDSVTTQMTRAEFAQLRKAVDYVAQELADGEK